MKSAPDGNAIVYCEGMFNTLNGKTAHGLVRFTKRYRVLSVIDSRYAGRDAGDVLDGKGKKIPIFLDEMFSNIGGELEICSYALPGSDELAQYAVKKIGEKNAVLLANHGAICCGKDLEQAFHVAETVEKICKIFVFSSIFGEIKSLPDDGIDYQIMMYEMMKDL